MIDELHLESLPPFGPDNHASDRPGATVDQAGAEFKASSSEPVASPDPAAQVPALETATGEAPKPETDDRPERLAAALGIQFHDLDLLRLALTHRSMLHDWLAAGGDPDQSESNERLEFLGDAFLGAIVAEHLYRRYPKADEGTLTARRVALVRAETLVRWAREINLGSYLYLGHGERITASARDRMLAGAFEAVVGAIAMDRGVRAAKRFLRPFLDRDTEAIAVRDETANPKGMLQELLQERFRLAPVYRTVAVEGPAHARHFSIEVTMAGKLLGTGTGGSKRAAQQAAARAALAKLAEEPDISLAAEEEPGAPAPPAAETTETGT